MLGSIVDGAPLSGTCAALGNADWSLCWFAVSGAVYGGVMEPARREIDEAAEHVVRFHRPDEPLSAAAEEALRRRTPEEHQAAIDRALRRS
jgi:hypothetical protein